MLVRCLYDQMVPIDSLKPHPKNTNRHPLEQIQRLAKILEYQGWRYPVKVSKQSGFVTSGHGRIDAARLNGWTEIPVNFQDYDDEASEFADVTADNAVASWAELDFSAINAFLPDYGPELNVDMLGIKDFDIEPTDKTNTEVEITQKTQFILVVELANEMEMKNLFEELNERQFQCKLIT